MLSKTAAICLILLLAGFGCVTRDTGQLTPQQISEIKADVKATTDDLAAKIERLDVAGFFESCQESPDWSFFGPDGSRADLQTAKAATIEGYRYLKSHKTATAREDIAVLSRDVAVWGWIGRVEDTVTSGEKAITDPLAVTLVLKKVAGRWKVVWWHNSCGSPVVEQAAQK